MADLKAVMAAARFKAYLLSLDQLSRAAVVEECKKWVGSAPTADPQQKRAVLNWLTSVEEENAHVQTAGSLHHALNNIWAPFFTLAKAPTLQTLIKAMDL